MLFSPHKQMVCLRKCPTFFANLFPSLSEFLNRFSALNWCKVNVVFSLGQTCLLTQLVLSNPIVSLAALPMILEGFCLKKDLVSLLLKKGHFGFMPLSAMPSIVSTSLHVYAVPHTSVLPLFLYPVYESVGNKRVYWGKITQIRKDCFSSLIISVLLFTCFVSSFSWPFQICLYMGLTHCLDDCTCFCPMLSISLSLPFTCLCVFLILLINVLLGCLTRELRAQGNFLQTKLRQQPF